MPKEERQGLIINRKIDRKLTIGSVQVELKSNWSLAIGRVVSETETTSEVVEEAKYLEAITEEVVEVKSDEADQSKAKLSR